MSINDLAGKWLLKNSDQVIVLATANGTKTVEQLMAEALTTVRAISIPANTAYHIIKLSVPNGSGTVSQLDAFNMSGNDLITDLSNNNLSGFNLSANSDTSMTQYFLTCGNNRFLSFTSNTNGTIAVVDYKTRVPASGTKFLLKYDEYVKV